MESWDIPMKILAFLTVFDIPGLVNGEQKTDGKDPPFYSWENSL